MCLFDSGDYCFFFQAEDGIRDLVRSRGLGDVYKRQSRGAPAARRRRNDKSPKSATTAAVAAVAAIVAVLSLIHI